MEFPIIGPINRILMARADRIETQTRQSQVRESMVGVFTRAEERFVLGMGKVERELSDMSRRDFLAQAMAASTNDPFVKNGLRNQTNFVVGTGSIIQSDNDAALDQWKEWKQLNEFDRKEKEIERRAARDGDAFIRYSGFGPLMQIRFIDSETIQAPISPPFPANWSGGIATLPEDVETVLGYWALRNMNDSNSGEFIDAAEVTHYKFEGDSTAKFGVAIMRAVLRVAKQLDIELDYQHTLLRMRLAIAMTEKVHAAPSGINTGTLSADGSPRRTGNANYVKAFKEGAILTHNEGVELGFISPNLDAGDVVQLFAYQGRRIAAAFGQPEYMVTADASNNNRAGSIVAGSPFFKAVSSERDSLGPVILEIYERVTGDTAASVEWKRVDSGGLAEEAKALMPARLNGDISRKTYQERIDVDPETEEERLAEEEEAAGADEEDFRLARERDAGQNQGQEDETDEDD